MVRTYFFFSASLVLVVALVGATDSNETVSDEGPVNPTPIEVVTTLKPTTTTTTTTTTAEPTTTTSTTTTTIATTTTSTTTTSTTTPTEPPMTEKVEEKMGPMVGAEMEVVEEETKKPPNEWGTYYWLPSEIPDMSDTFNQVFLNYLDSDNPKTECRENDADFNRWYKSSENPDHALLSYYCKSKPVRGYEHLKVSLSKLNVLDFQGSLKGFQITDAGDYETELAEDAAEEIRNELLPHLIDQIALQKEDSADQDEICPDPGTETFAVASEKYENGLYYDRIAVSCNKTITESGIPSHMTYIEVVTDRDFKILNDGNPVLISMDTKTSRNTMFIQEEERLKEEEALKQVDGVPAFLPGLTSIVSLVAMYILQRLF